MIARTFRFERPMLTAALRRTFERRGTAWPTDVPPGLSESFVADKAGQRQAFLGRERLGAAWGGFEAVLDGLRAFRLPLVTGANVGATWTPSGLWRGDRLPAVGRRSGGAAAEGATPGPADLHTGTARRPLRWLVVGAPSIEARRARTRARSRAGQQVRGTGPWTPAAALNDSPAGLAARITGGRGVDVRGMAPTVSVIRDGIAKPGLPGPPATCSGFGAIP